MFGWKSDQKLENLEIFIGMGFGGWAPDASECMRF